MKKIILLLVCLILFGFIFATDYIFFYGEGCPHCANVEKYLDSVDGFSKLNIQKKEIWSNPTNAQEMSMYGSKFGLKPEEIGVPFLLIKDGEKYDYKIGDEPMIEYFKNILGEAKQTDNSYLNSKVIVPLLFVVIVLGLVSFNIFQREKG